MNYIEKAKSMLKNWVKYSLNDLYTPPDRPDLMCYGSGYNGWGMQTHQKGFAAFAILAVSEDIDISDLDVSKSDLLEYSLKMLRFMLESHIEGNYMCVEGDNWGHTWISPLGTERCMHAVERLEKHLTEDDKVLLKKVLISEANWLLDHHDIQAYPIGFTGKNRPESNIWNGSFLHRTAIWYPEYERVDEFREKGTKYLVNGISVPKDANSNITYANKKVSQWYEGNNFFDSFSLDHHSYLNTGYMAICISNIAMLHFSCKSKNVKAPEALYHNARELWQLLKTCIFKDGRIVRIGGESRLRYTYCQDYMLPALNFARDYLKDKDAIAIEKAYINLVEKEYEYNNNGSFFSKRCNDLREISPIYYTRLESDRASVLSMLLDWDELVDVGEIEIKRLSSWQEEFHGACISNGKKRFASWVWRASQGAMGLCLPKGKSDTAEWRNNLAGEIEGTGVINTTECVNHIEKLFEGGFLTFGVANRESKKFLAEQQKDEVTAIEKITFVALPDDATIVVMQHAITPQRTYIKTIKGINWNMANDVFNNFERTYHYNQTKKVIKGLTGNEEVIETNSNWLNVDNSIGIIMAYGQESLKIYRPGKRQIGIKIASHVDNTQNNKTNNFWTDVICGECRIKPHWVDKNKIVLDEGAVITCNVDAKETKEKAKYQNQVSVNCSGNARAIITIGQDKKTYIVLSNFGGKEEKVTINSNNHTYKSLIDNKIYENSIILTENSADLLIME